MPFPVLHEYLVRLHGNAGAATRVWADDRGCVYGRFFHSTLTSVFQPIRRLEDEVAIGYEGYARSRSDSDAGLSLWRLLDHAASDDESVALDRLCRMLHAINFFRQAESGDGDLYLSVHARLMAAVDGDHGRAFSHVLRLLGLPRERIVLQLPAVAQRQEWLLGYVADNYRRNGFRIALNAGGVHEALKLAGKLRPEAIRVDARHILDGTEAVRLLEVCAAIGVRVLFKRVEQHDVADLLHGVSRASGVPVLAQGFLWGRPAAALPFALDETPRKTGTGRG